MKSFMVILGSWIRVQSLEVSATIEPIVLAPVFLLQGMSMH